jgi:hypothetical protein
VRNVKAHKAAGLKTTGLFQEREDGHDDVNPPEKTTQTDTTRNKRRKYDLSKYSDVGNKNCPWMSIPEHVLACLKHTVASIPNEPMEASETLPMAWKQAGSLCSAHALSVDPDNQDYVCPIRPPTRFKQEVPSENTIARQTNSQVSSTFRRLKSDMLECFSCPPRRQWKNCRPMMEGLQGVFALECDRRSGVHPYIGEVHFMTRKEAEDWMCREMNMSSLWQLYRELVKRKITRYKPRKNGVYKSYSFEGVGLVRSSLHICS